MKVILLHDVPNVGRKYDVKEVSNGYGRNYLISRGLAKVATEKEIKNANELKVRREQEKKIREDLLMKNLEELSAVVVTIKEKANEKGHLFAGIHNEEILPALKKQTHLGVEAEHIVLEHPIKEVGEYDIPVAVGEKKTSFKLIVEAA